MNPKEKEYSFMLTGIPTSLYKLLPLPYARPSRVEWIREAIRTYAAILALSAQRKTSVAELLEQIEKKGE